MSRHYLELLALAEDRREQLLREAEMERLADEARVANASTQPSPARPPRSGVASLWQRLAANAGWRNAPQPWPEKAPAVAGGVIAMTDL